MHRKRPVKTSSPSMEWKDWCRLCAKADSQSGVDVLSTQKQVPWEEDDPLTSKRNSATAAKSLLDAMELHFNVHPTKEEHLPTKICSECCSLLTSLAGFSERVARVQKMYRMLHKNIKRQRKLDLDVLRLEYGLLDEERQILPKEELAHPTAQAIEESLIEIENEPTFTANPLDQPLLECYIKSEPEECTVIDGAPQPDRSEYREKRLRMDTADDESSRRKLEKYQRRHHRSPSVSSSVTEDSHGSTSSHSELQISSKQRPTSTCPQCHETVRNLRLHLIRKHAASGEALLLKCDKCPRTFAAKHLLSSHTRVHLPMEMKKVIPCPHCDKKFCTKTLVQTHIKQVHLDERPFVCEECGVALRTMAVLKDHMLLHTDLLPFECDVCGKAFKHQNTLRRHKDIHSPTKYKCPICSTELNSRVTFQRHQLVHMDVMGHKCDYCGRAFKRAQTLKNHLILHTGLKPYTCDFCDATFTSGPNCRAHKKRNHPKELAEWEANGNEMYTRNVPKLADLKAFTKAAKTKGSHLFTPMSYEKDSEQASCSSPRTEALTHE